MSGLSLLWTKTSNDMSLLPLLQYLHSSRMPEPPHWVIVETDVGRQIWRRSELDSVFGIPCVSGSVTAVKVVSLTEEIKSNLGVKLYELWCSMTIMFSHVMMDMEEEDDQEQ